MATLTTSWQNVASYKFNPGTGFICTFYLDAKYSSQSTANNTTTIQTRLNCTVNQGSGGGNGYRFALSYASTKEGSTYWTFETETISTGSTTITHNNDGKKDVTLSASMRVNYTGLDASMSATVTLPRINRQATITSAPNFNDEENPTITYSNPLGNNVTSLQACISLTGSIDDIAYRDISKTGTSYTFELTEAERNVLRQATTDKTRTIKFYVKTQYSGNTFYSSVSKTLSIINANPTFTYSVVETNQKAINVLGTSKALWLIENVSQPKISVVPTAYKYATISNVVVTNGNNTAELTKSPYEATLNATSGTSSILVTDSRGFSASETIERPLISYIPVAINNFDFKRENPTSSNLILNASFTYTQTTFNNTYNVPTIRWKCNEDGELHTISTDNYIIDTENRKISISNLLLENVISYKEQAELFIYIDDLLTSATNHMPVIKGIPVMDWGEHDVQINGDLLLADENRKNSYCASDKFVVEIIKSNRGQAIKYANGTMIQTMKFDVSVTFGSTWGSLYSSGDKTISAQGIPDFLVPFKEVPVCVKTIQGRNNLNAWLATGGESDATKTNPGSVQLVRGSAGGGTNVYTIGVWAMGFWK